MDNDASFCCNFWDFLHGKRPNAPNALDYGLTLSDGRSLMRHCMIEYNRLYAKELPEHHQRNRALHQEMKL